MSKGQTLQDPFLNSLRKDRIPVSIFLVNGIKLQGQIESFDQYVVLLKNTVSQMVYKHAISTVVPARNPRGSSQGGSMGGYQGSGYDRGSSHGGGYEQGGFGNRGGFSRGSGMSGFDRGGFDRGDRGGNMGGFADRERSGFDRGSNVGGFADRGFEDRGFEERSFDDKRGFEGGDDADFDDNDKPDDYGNNN